MRTKIRGAELQKRFDRATDRSFRRAHSIRLAGRSYHPYFIFHDLSVAGMAFIAFLYDARGLALVLPVYLALASYRFYLRGVKRWIFKTSARSFLLDTFLWILPILGLTYFYVGVDPSRYAPYLASVFAWHLAMTRLGCYFGGCCYGNSCTWGVLYPQFVFERKATGRLYAPGRVPDSRVIPVQLIEAAASFAMLAFFLTHRQLDLRYYLVG